MRASRWAVLIGLGIVLAVPAQALPAPSVPSATLLQDAPRSSSEGIGEVDLTVGCTAEVPVGGTGSCSATWSQQPPVALDSHKFFHETFALRAHYTIDWIDPGGNTVYHETCSLAASGDSAGLLEWWAIRFPCEESSNAFQGGNQRLEVTATVQECTSDPCTFHGGLKLD